MLVFLENITYCAFLDKSGLKIIFHLYSLSEFFLDFYLIDQPTYWGRRQLMCHLSLTEDSKPSGRSFMYIRKSNGPKIDPCGTPANNDNQFEHWPLSTTL